MKKIVSILLLGIAFSAFLTSCKSEPKVIDGKELVMDMAPNSLPSMQKSNATAVSHTSNIHQVVVREVLSTEKYNYLKVNEGAENYWIAISKSDVALGKTYFFRNGLLKRNFFSREFNRVFDTVYLVSEIWSKEQPKQMLPQQGASNSHTQVMPDLGIGTIDVVSGATSLQHLFEDKAAFSEQVIKVTGKCVKVNPKIMGRNWLHIQDGSGKNLDLTVTTTEEVPLGAIVTLEGTIATDKDFGAGYRYDIIMEGAKVIQ